MGIYYFTFLRKISLLPKIRWSNFFWIEQSETLFGIFRLNMSTWKWASIINFNHSHFSVKIAQIKRLTDDHMTESNFFPYKFSNNEMNSMKCNRFRSLNFNWEFTVPALYCGDKNCIHTCGICHIFLIDAHSKF